MSSTVELTRPEPHIARLALDRPDRLNALTFEMVVDLHDAFDELAADPECKVDVVANQARVQPVGSGISTSLAFGGNDAAVVMRRPG